MHCRCKNCLRVAHLFSRRPPRNPAFGFCSWFFQCAGFVGWIELPVGESISVGERECHLPQWALAASFPRSLLFSRSASREEPLHEPWICWRRRIHLLRLEISLNSDKSAVQLLLISTLIFSNPLIFLQDAMLSAKDISLASLRSLVVDCVYCAQLTNEGDAAILRRFITTNILQADRYRVQPKITAYPFKSRGNL